MLRNRWRTMLQSSAFAIMAGIDDLPDTLPPAYTQVYGGTTLRDPPGVALPDERELRVLREFAESSVRTIKRLVFPIHGLSTA